MKIYLKILFVLFILGGGTLTILSCSPKIKEDKKVVVKIETPYQLVYEKAIYIVGKDTLRYQFLRPQTIDATKKYPFLIFYHGAGQRGSDNETPVMDVPWVLRDSIGRIKYPCYILIPQCPLNKRWVEVNWNDKTEVMPAKISMVENLTLKLLDSLKTNFPSVDLNRLYITGLSMGGFATWDVICRYPDEFAAAVPVCGGGDETQAEKLIHIPIWAFHGKLDKTVFTSRSINMVNAVNAKGGNAKLTLYDNVSHGSWNNAYRDSTLFEWLFLQHK